MLRLLLPIIKNALSSKDDNTTRPHLRCIDPIVSRTLLSKSTTDASTENERELMQQEVFSEECLKALDMLCRVGGDEKVFRGNVDMLREPLRARVTLGFTFWQDHQPGTLPEHARAAREMKRVLLRSVMAPAILLAEAGSADLAASDNAGWSGGYRMSTPQSVIRDDLQHWCPVPCDRLKQGIQDWGMSTCYDALMMVNLRFRFDPAEFRSDRLREYVLLLRLRVVQLTALALTHEEMGRPQKPSWQRVLKLGGEDERKMGTEPKLQMAGGMDHKAVCVRVRDHVRREKRKALEEHEDAGEIYIAVKERARQEEEKRKGQMASGAEHLYDKDRVEIVEELVGDFKEEEEEEEEAGGEEEEDTGLSDFLNSAKSGDWTGQQREWKEGKGKRKRGRPRNDEGAREAKRVEQEQRSKAQRELRETDERISEEELVVSTIPWATDIGIVLDGALSRVLFPRMQLMPRGLVSHKYKELREAVHKVSINAVLMAQELSVIKKMRSWISTLLVSETEMQILAQESSNTAHLSVADVRLFTRKSPVVCLSENAESFGEVHQQGMAALDTPWFPRIMDAVREKDNEWFDLVMAFCFTYFVEQSFPGVSGKQLLWIQDPALEYFSADRRPLKTRPYLVHLEGSWGVIRDWTREDKEGDMDAIWFAKFVDAATFFLVVARELSKDGGICSHANPDEAYAVGSRKLWEENAVV